MSAQNVIIPEKKFFKYLFKDIRPQSKNEYHFISMINNLPVMIKDCRG